MQSPTHPTASNAQPKSSGVNDVDLEVTERQYSLKLALALFLMIAIGGCLLDLATKSWIFGRLGAHQIEQGILAPPIWIIENIFGFETSLNEGAVFGIGQGQVFAFASLSILAGIGILVWLFVAGGLRDLHLTIALGCVMAGILGNLYDRLGLHELKWGGGQRQHSVGDPVYAVRDWLHFKIDPLHFDWPIFNLADSLLVCGAILLVWHAIRHGD